MKTLKHFVLVASLLQQSCGDGSAVSAVTQAADIAPKCEPETKTAAPESATPEPAAPPAARASSQEEVKSSKAAKLTMEGCTDPDLSKLAKGEPITLCSGETGYGTFVAEEKPSYANCSRNGQTGCIASGRFAANDVTGLEPSVLKSGTTVAEVSGTYAAPSYVNCSQNGQVGCLAASPYAANDVSGLAPANIRSGVTIAGVAGSFDPVIESHTDCSARGQSGCIATSSFPTIDAASSALIVAGNIKNGVTIAGVTGSYPSATTPLSGASSTADLTSATFYAKVKSSAQFEYFDSTGARHADQGSDSIQESFIRSGTSIFGVAGTYGSTDVNTYDVRSGVTVNGVTGTMQADCRAYENSIPAGKACNKSEFSPYSVDGCDGSRCQITRNTMKVWQKVGGGSTTTAFTYAQLQSMCALITDLGGGWRVPSIPELHYLLPRTFGANQITALSRALDDTGFWAVQYNSRVIVDTMGSIVNASPTAATTGATMLCVKDL